MGLMTGKVCLVTGAGRGIGAATARRLAEEGAIVWACDVSSDGVSTVCETLSSEGYEAHSLVLDVRDEKAARQAVVRIRKESGSIDVLVNNAGIMRDALIGMIPKSLMDEIYSVNVWGVANMTQVVAKVMMRQGCGSIVNLCSIVGVEGNPGQLVYSATKGAVAAMTKTASKELSPKGIRVNAVAPGMIDTEMFRSIGPEHMAERLSHVRMGRLGTPEDVADAILFLASDLSRYVTGEILGVDGEASV